MDPRVDQTRDSRRESSAFVTLGVPPRGSGEDSRYAENVIPFASGTIPAGASFMSFLITPSASIAIQENSSWRVELRAVLALAFPVILQVR